MQPLRSILYYENDHDILVETVFSLREKGDLDVSVFETFDASIAHLHLIYPNLILMNAQMPDLSGMEILYKLRKQEHLSEIPAVLYTRESLDKEVVNNNNLGILDVLKKPMRGVDLNIRLHEIWRGFNA